MTQSIEEICQIVGTHADQRWNADDNRWEAAKAVIGSERVTLGPQATDQYLHAPEHLAMVLARYRASAALIGGAQSVLEIGCGEGIGARMLAKDRVRYTGIDTDCYAISVAQQVHAGEMSWRSFEAADAIGVGSHSPGITRQMDAVVSLDVIEHIPADCEDVFMRNAVDALTPDGVLVIGTPNAAFEHLASPQSRAGHVNLYSHARLHALMSKHFRVVQSFGMQDTSIHLGHPDARHYLLMCGIGPR